MLSLAAASTRGPPPSDCTSVHCTADVQGGWSGRWRLFLRNGYTQRIIGTLMTLVSHCTVLRVGESLRECLCVLCAVVPQVC